MSLYEREDGDDDWIESVLKERDALRAKLQAAEAEVARLRVLWEACLENKEGLRLGEDVCAALNDLSDFEATNRLLDGRGE